MARQMEYGLLVKDGPLLAESGWISPTGNWWSVSHASHWSFAAERLPAGTTDAVATLEQRGWVHVSYVGTFFGDRCELSSGQADTLLRWMSHAHKDYTYGSAAYRDAVRIMGFDPYANK
jgi:hypothetical protein